MKNKFVGEYTALMESRGNSSWNGVEDVLERNEIGMKITGKLSENIPGYATDYPEFTDWGMAFETKGFISTEGAKLIQVAITDESRSLTLLSGAPDVDDFIVKAEHINHKTGEVITMTVPKLGEPLVERSVLSVE